MRNLYRRVPEVVGTRHRFEYVPVDLTSPETIEKAARAYADHMGWVYVPDLDDDKMEAVLRAVTEDTQ